MGVQIHPKYDAEEIDNRFKKPLIKSIEDETLNEIDKNNTFKSVLLGGPGSWDSVGQETCTIRIHDKVEII